MVGWVMLILRRLLVRLSVNRVPVLRFLVWVHALAGVAMVLVLLAGCDHHEGEVHAHEDDFIVSFPSPLEMVIRRPFDRPFDVLEIGVTPFVSPGLGSEPYGLVVSGIAWFDGAEIVFDAHDIVPRAFIDPLGERVVDVIITCDCFVDYVILRSRFGETTIFFD
jgi:hypothetical protein